MTRLFASLMIHEVFFFQGQRDGASSAVLAWFISCSLLSVIRDRLKPTYSHQQWDMFGLSYQLWTQAEGFRQLWGGKRRCLKRVSLSFAIWNKALCCTGGGKVLINSVYSLSLDGIIINWFEGRELILCVIAVLEVTAHMVPLFTYEPRAKKDIRHHFSS